MVYNIEKMLKESGDKVSGSEKSDVESALADAKKTLEGTPSATELNAAREKLTAASHKLAEAMYKASAQRRSNRWRRGCCRNHGRRAQEGRRRHRRGVRGRRREEVKVVGNASADDHDGVCRCEGKGRSQRM